MNELKMLYNNNVNIMKFFRDEQNIRYNTLDAILYSYDLQSGSYTEQFYSDKIDSRLFTNMCSSASTTRGGGGDTQKNVVNCRSDEISFEINKTTYNSILDVGTGEATGLCGIAKRLNNQKCDVFGIDVSYSRILFAKKFEREQGITGLNLLVGDMFYLPFSDSSIDIVYTNHCIEPNTNRAAEALKELYRVSKKYLILCEPAYDLGNDETKKRMIEQGYITNLWDEVKRLDYKVLTHRLMKSGAINNQSAMTVIEKQPVNANESKYACPKCKRVLNDYKDIMFCDQCMLMYPIIKDIPVLTKESAILASKYPMFFDHKFDNSNESV